MRIRLPLDPLSTRSFPLLRFIGFAALLLGCRAAWLYHTAGLTLSHYDAKAHLVVARRVVDNLTPGWQQLGAVWLPLPHLLNLLPVQIDTFYRTGASAVAISVLAFALSAYGVARLVLRASGSRIAAAAAASVLALNPDLLYLQSTPMTEALLFGLLVMAAALTFEWLETLLWDPPSGGFHVEIRLKPDPTTTAVTSDDASPAEAGSRDAFRRATRRAGLVIAAACLTRYEAWPVTAALLALSAVSLWLRGFTARDALRHTARLAKYPAAAALLFLVQSRLTVGHWFVTGGFFVPDNIDTGNPFRAVASVWWGAHVIGGHVVELTAAAGAIACIVTAFRHRSRSALLVPLALLAAGALPAYAFFDGHPFRIRYMTPLVPALAITAGLGVGLLPRRLRRAAAVALVALALAETSPFDFRAPMLLEAQLDSGNSAARREVTRYLSAHYDGRTIMASMASLAHYMQELSHAGFEIRDFLHEGNGQIWDAALGDPRPHVGWILVEEWAEGGDRLAKRAVEDGHFLEGFERVAEGGGVALYRLHAIDASASWPNVSVVGSR